MPQLQLIMEIDIDQRLEQIRRTIKTNDQSSVMCTLVPNFGQKLLSSLQSEKSCSLQNQYQESLELITLKQQNQHLTNLVNNLKKSLNENTQQNQIKIKMRVQASCQTFQSNDAQLQKARLHQKLYHMKEYIQSLIQQNNLLKSQNNAVQLLLQQNIAQGQLSYSRFRLQTYQMLLNNITPDKILLSKLQYQDKIISMGQKLANMIGSRLQTPLPQSTKQPYRNYFYRRISGLQTIIAKMHLYLQNLKKKLIGQIQKIKKHWQKQFYQLQQSYQKKYRKLSGINKSYYCKIVQQRGKNALQKVRSAKKY